MNKEKIKELKDNGFCVLENKISESWVAKIKKVLPEVFESHHQTQLNLGNENTVPGVALNVLLDNHMFIEFLEYLMESGLLDEIKKNFFKSNFILNSFSALNNIPTQQNFSKLVHRDVRAYSGEIPLYLNILVMLDDFTETNGSTLVLPGSHLDSSTPSDEFFHANAVKTLGKKGDVLLFNGNLFHASGLNKSKKGRMALPITFTKSFYKQLMDYPRALGYERMGEFSEPLQQILGYHSRVPSNLNEWYQAGDKRFYKKNQD
jgi:ectoine hydroxylase-related dioxygenase (phytanoyl-CoA dioxygenase family)|tara:strand:- start:8773 stop:9558 length:786 start_codon:yes stop_codon:yes gene_type:complete